MSDLRELYQEVIVDHNRSPRNFHSLADANRQVEGFNPLCGDHLRLFLKVNQDNVIEDISFEGEGCAISVASASLMTEALKHKTTAEAEHIFQQFHQLITTDIELAVDSEALGKLNVLAGVREFPARVKCASLAWHSLHSALTQPETARISTE